MSKYSLNKPTSKFVQNYIKNRLWEKNTSEYVPFLSVRSNPTEGKANRIKGWKTGRDHHFLSRLECAAFYHFEWSDEIVDIKEQYPLLPMEILQNIASAASIEYPNFANTPIIMTTDFLIRKVENGKTTYHARTVKPYSKLSDERIIEKFEIEHRFFKSKNIDWGIITEKNLPEVFTYNMDILHSNKLNTDKGSLEKQHLFTMYKQLAMTIDKFDSKDIPIAYVLTQLSQNLNVEFSYILEIFFKAIINKIIVLDIYTKALNVNTLPLGELKVNNNLLSKSFNTL